MREGTIFITGATGFFGCWLLESFLHANRVLNLNAQMIALTRQRERFRSKAPHLADEPALTLLEGDLMDFAFPSIRCTHAIHAAADTDPRPGLALFDGVVTGTRRMLDFGVKNGVQKFLFTSSGAVYGKQPADMDAMPETYAGSPDLQSPASLYGEAKRVGEMLCAAYREEFGIEAKVARAFAFVGPHLPLHRHYAAGNFIRDALAQEPVRVEGDPEAVRSYMYASDLTAWLWKILFKGAPARPYNVGSSSSISIAELAGETASLANVPTVIERRHSASLSSTRYVPNVSRAEDELGLRQTVSLNEALRKTLCWHRSGAPAPLNV